MNNYSRLTEPKDFKDSWTYKYVLFSDGRVLFCDACIRDMDHKMIVSEHREQSLRENQGKLHISDIPAAVSAGKIRIQDKKWVISDGGSFTAELRRGENDEEFIQKTLGPDFIYDYEVIYSC